MKFFINNHKNILKEALSATLLHEPILKINSEEINVVIRSDWDKSKVALISGGGSGHEPAHVGFVGKGMLTSAVCGDVFASPTVDAVLSAIITTTGEAGCLLIIKNYTGDRLNFGLAAEQAKTLGYKVETVIVGDDIALGVERNRRGLAGTVLIHKIAGYYAEMGKSLSEIKNIVEDALQNLFTIGLSLTSCQKFDVPSSERLAADEVELGLGIHGEPGIQTIPFDNASSLVHTLSSVMKSYINDHHQYALLLNNLGSVTSLEMSVVLNELLKADNLQNYVTHLLGPHTFMTALNMKGISITLIQLNEQILTALSAPVLNNNWFNLQEIKQYDAIDAPKLPKLIQESPSENEQHAKVIIGIANLLIELEQELNSIDELVGDGDAGSTFATIGKKMLDYEDQLPFDNIQALLATIGRIIARDAGGSSGVLLSILFTKAATAYVSEDNLGTALSSGLEQMMAYGGAKVGSRTMIDALNPAFEAMVAGKSLDEIAQEARLGAEKTKLITHTHSGRSSYLNAATLQNIVDPGAEIIARIFEHIASNIKIS